jgi:hypothetical protein
LKQDHFLHFLFKNELSRLKSWNEGSLIRHGSYLHSIHKRAGNQ